MKKLIIVFAMILLLLSTGVTAPTNRILAENGDRVSFVVNLPETLYDGVDDVLDFISVDLPYDLDFDWGFSYTTHEPTVTNIGVEKGIQFIGWSFEANDNTISILQGQRLTDAVVPSKYRTLIENEDYTLELHAVFSRTAYNVTIKETGLINDPVYSIYQDETIGSIPNPTKPDKIFDGYVIEGTQTVFDENEKVSKDLTLVAQWVDPMVELKHDANVDPSVAPNDVSIFIDISIPSAVIWDSFTLTAADAPDITPKGVDLGVNFVGWSLVKGNDTNLILPGDKITEADVNINDYRLGGVINLYAIYSRPEYTVTIKDTPTSAGQSFRVQHGDLFTSLNYTPSNGVNVFQGYTLEGTQSSFDPNTKIKQNYTLVGNWKENTNSTISDLTSNIIWRGGNEPRPNVTVSLLNDNVLVETQTALSGTNAIVWKAMPDSDSNGNVIKYNVTTSAVVDYIITYDGLNVILTYNGNSNIPNPNPNDGGNGNPVNPVPNPNDGGNGNPVNPIPNPNDGGNSNPTLPGPSTNDSPNIIPSVSPDDNPNNVPNVSTTLPQTGVSSTASTFAMVFLIFGSLIVIVRKKYGHIN